MKVGFAHWIANPEDKSYRAAESSISSSWPLRCVKALVWRAVSESVFIGPVFVKPQTHSEV